MNEYDGANGGGGDVVVVMTMITLKWDVCTEVCCKNQFRNG
jgi:hypothetical protein